ncbi:polar amino acid ABC transporter substrate-binding protein [Bordetella genomosp. 10]|uniref:Polar amino acid ABC transporter substrate-binding protein n=1 Tax=Bordetella genomosp. 10 TaxID=1416804 RepID=A0A261SJ13_9BORD|nr:transporter substrate-binding domain-containing protein [Bordetella genomosp. 10]OZI37429.1 polar amino acid ABC transporter substrate-binding protein [Bordetella genomosp. 10]
MQCLTKLIRQCLLGSALLLGAATAGMAQTGPIRTAVDSTFAPHAMTKLDGGLQGFNIDLGHEIAKRLGREITIEPAEFSGLVPGLNSGRYDFLIAPVTVTPERAKSLLFTEGYLDTDYTFLGKKSTPPVTSLDDLKGKVIAVNKGSNYEAWAKENAEKYGFKYEVYGANADAVQAVIASRADYNLAGTTVVAWTAKQNPRLATSYTIKTGLVWAVAFRRDDQAGRAKVSNVLKCMKKDGTIAALAKKWFGFTPKPEDSAVAIAAGTGVPGMDGYDPTPVTPTCP